MLLDYSYRTDVGLVRRHNEDAVKILKNPDYLLMMIADGMGGHTSGDVAANLAIEHIEKTFENGLNLPTKEVAATWLSDALKAINEKILAYAAKNKVRKMGTTMVITVVTNNYITIANIGDSRAYILANNHLRQITKDHTFVRELVEKGQISERAAKLHPQKNVINRALGASKKLQTDIVTVEHYDIDGLLLCTDGLTGLVEDLEIFKTLSKTTSAEAKMTELIESANARGGRDNISVAWAQFETEEVGT